MATVMTQETYLDRGERIFVGAVAFVLAAETLATIVCSGTQFAWPRLILGVFGGVFILYLAQRLYAGDATVERLALGWAGFQVVLMLVSILLGSSGPQLVQDIGVPWRGLAFIKLLAYAVFAACLQMRGSARAFLVSRRGEEVAKYLPAEVVIDTTPVTLPPEQAKALGDLSSLMTKTALALIVVGVVVIVNVIPLSLNISRRGAVGVLEGLLTLGLGVLLLVPAQTLGKNPDAATVGWLESAWQRLTWWHFAAAAVGLLLLIAVVLRFLIEWAQ
ncbi:MAG: hypothetical protein L0Y71_15185 [Gemmataceae bacterium]|nr:hypothetical protein [Gemmataceae bacterium]